jgi:hypothetical protein
VITIGQDTTVLDGPLAPDGLVDFVTAFDQRLSAGVTPENNTAIPLLEAFGPARIPDEYRTRFFAALGCPTPPAVGDDIVGPASFAEVPQTAPNIRIGDSNGQSPQAHYRQSCFRHSPCPDQFPVAPMPPACNPAQC